MRNTVRDVGSAGIIRDTKPALLPSNVWTNGRNVRFERNRLYRMNGVEEALTVTDLLNIGLVSSPTDDFFIYTNDAGGMFAFDGSTTYDINPTDFTVTENLDNLMDIESYNGFALMNNDLTGPRIWNPLDPLTNNTAALPNWNAGWVCRKMRRYKEFLIALNISESGVNYPHKIRWSSPAEAGAVPSTWDDSDPTNLAGSYSFADTDKGILIDGLELGNNFIIYKESAIHMLTFVGGNNVFSRTPVIQNIGLNVPRSLINLPFTRQSASVQFFAGEEGFYILDGVRVQPVFEDVFANEIIRVADDAFYRDRSFSVVNYKNKELWFCVPERGSEVANLAYCFNFYNNSYTIRELSGASKVVAGSGFYVTTVAASEDLPFSDDTYFEDGSGFYDVTAPISDNIIIEASRTEEKIFYLDRGYGGYTPGSYFDAYVERESLGTVKQDNRNDRADIVDYSKRKLLTAVIPKFYEGTGLLRVGTQEIENEPIDWHEEISLSSYPYRLDLAEPMSGRFLSFRFSSVADQPFGMGGFDYEVSMLGEF